MDSYEKRTRQIAEEAWMYLGVAGVASVVALVAWLFSH